MGRKISTYYTDNDKGHCEVHMDFKNEYAYIKYFDNNGKLFHTEEYPNKTVAYVENIAEDWVLGVVPYVFGSQGFTKKGKYDMMYTIEVEADSNGELMLEFPDELMDALNWQAGETVTWTDNEDGSWTITKEKTNE